MDKAPVTLAGHSNRALLAMAGLGCIELARPFLSMQMRWALCIFCPSDSPFALEALQTRNAKRPLSTMQRQAWRLHLGLPGHITNSPFGHDSC